MRLQKYTKPFEYEGRGFVFDQVYARLFEVPYSVYYLLKEKNFTELQKEFPDVFSFFTSNNILVSDNFNELQYLDLTVKRHNQGQNNNNLSLTIAPTLNCNFMCPYCYEEENARQVSFMSKEVADNTLRFIKHQLNGPNAGVFISWYGGEPLLAVHTIQYISQELKKVIGNRLSASITTNGFLLTEKVAKILQESNVYTAQVTIDGLKETHDKRRPFIDKNVSSFDKVVDNLKSNAKYFRRIDIRINVDKENEKEVPALIEYLKSILPNNVQYYASRTRRESLCTSFPVEYYYKSEEYANFMKLHPSYNVPFAVGYGCGATDPRSHVIDANGDLFRCWHEVGQKNKAVGNVVEGITNWDRYSRWMNFGADMLSNSCKNCSIVAVCMGGLCPYRVVFPKENVDSQICIPIKFYLDDFLIRRVIRNENIERIGFSDDLSCQQNPPSSIQAGEKE